MKVSYNWLKDYISTELSPQDIAQVLTSTGLEVESVELSESIRGGLRGVVVGHVVECAKHPDADRLSLTKVDIGSGELLQIVCGAPNVAAGQKVFVATVGTTLYPVQGEPLTIKKGKIRGQESAGMICAEDELGIGQSHAGIMVLGEAASVGMPAAEYLGITEDYCLEIGLTPNRTDAISHYGVARDLFAAIINKADFTGDRKASLSFPVIPKIDVSNDHSVSVMDTSACPRYCGVRIEGVKVEDSPKWLADRLKTIGLKPINNIVDITNYVQHELGQPLHAFDLRKIEGDKVIVRKAKSDEAFTTLDGVGRKLNADDLVICDSVKPMCIAGVFGGIESGVSGSTNSVFLESAYFSPSGIRKTARRHGLNTDASFRFERGCDPSMTFEALCRATSMILEIAGGTIKGHAVDLYPVSIEKNIIDFSLTKSNALIGKEISAQVYDSILTDLEFGIEKISELEWKLTVPGYRTDVVRQADVVEEVLRIYGYDNVEQPAKMKSALSFAPAIDAEKMEHAVADYLVATGFSEMMSLSLTKKNYSNLLSDSRFAEATSIQLLNPLSNDLAILRQTLLFSGLEAIERNQNHKNADLRLFEFGKQYSKHQNKYAEEKHLALFLTGNKFAENWDRASQKVSFYDLKAAVAGVFRLLRINNVSTSESDYEFFDQGVSFSLNNNSLVQLGRVSSRLLTEFGIKNQVYYADFNWERMLKALPKKAQTYTEPEKFPAVRRDLSLLIDKAVSFDQIELTARNTDKKILREVGLFDVYEGKNLAEGKKSYAVSFVLQDSSKTMTDKQVEQVMGKILENLKKTLGAELRS